MSSLLQQDDSSVDLVQQQEQQQQHHSAKGSVVPMVVAAPPPSPPLDVAVLSSKLRQRIRNYRALQQIHHQALEILEREDQDSFSARSHQTSPRNKQQHVVGQTGCFCMDCLKHRHQEWRIGDINTNIVGPRDQWRQYCWGNTERGALLMEPSANTHCALAMTPAIRETIRVHTKTRPREIPIERDAKLVAVASGKYHTLLLSESSHVFACGDNSYGALGALEFEPRDPEKPFAYAPIELTQLGAAGGKVEMIAASGFASFALVVAPIVSLRRQSIIHMPKKELSILERKDASLNAKEQSVVNHLMVWGRGDNGVLGLGDTKSRSTPTRLGFFDAMRVIQISAGLHHVLVLTDYDGLFVFGDGAHGKLGLGDTLARMSPCKVALLENQNVTYVSAGDQHSVAITGDSPSNHQVFSWGLGLNGRLGHNDLQDRLKPTRVNFFRGRKVITVSCGGAHSLAISETPNGTSVWSWGCGAYGQLGHRDTWDALLPRSISEIRRDRIQFVDAGERHSLAITARKEIWVWGQGIHGGYDVTDADPFTTSILFPVKVVLPGIHIISAAAGRGRTFVWGDRAVESFLQERPFGGTDATECCSMLPECEALSSTSFRILYHCRRCQKESICIACAHRCHQGHHLELDWAMEQALSRDCDCFVSGDCTFDASVYDEDDDDDADDDKTKPSPEQNQVE